MTDKKARRGAYNTVDMIDSHIIAPSIRAVPNIRLVFASAPNSGPNRLFVFGRIVLPRPNTNSA